MDFSAVYSQISILFLLIIGGYALGKLEIITKEMVKSLTTFILKISTPALVIGGMMIPRTAEKLKESVIIVIISFSIYAGSFIFAKLVTKIIKVPLSNKGIFEFAMIFSNVGFMGFPVIQALFGKEAIFYTAMYNMPFYILIYTLGIALMNTQEGDHKVNMKAVINPGSVASIIGFIIFALAIPIPEVIGDGIVLVGSTTTPISMIVVGAMLSALPLSKMFVNWYVYIISSIRVLVLPLIVYLVFKFVLYIDHPMLIGVPVMITAMPVAANAALIAQEYGSKPEIASQCIFISTLMSIITIPLLSLLFI